MATVPVCLIASNVTCEAEYIYVYNGGLEYLQDERAGGGGIIFLRFEANIDLNRVCTSFGFIPNGKLARSHEAKLNKVRSTLLFQQHYCRLAPRS